ncbi:hypothetical protein TTHERM_00046370 (macronuclear) [Tetrahymena thermophila SB210]|uniref:Uncharacterized protein n=1 Tax=Tetrahymena thermophila (strain SB210) TaxID=312017 RepID=Q23DQ4_TETTS|nr:hypothetical protein TTHERM_00046370 [Tetrahymena thermophila SB210]EAR94350.2 hypothetical protein TTHERM_00046370 [Tetrahymena thermophila SB210]|eukprot:XP_001014632.2 hypothetical protein TTHERM_00046370 [Tetrahymena thermophila SB210]
MDKTNKASFSNQSMQQTTFPSKKVSYDKIKISDLCLRGNVHAQNQSQNKISISQAQENVILCQKTKLEDKKSIQLDQDLSADIISKIGIDNYNKNMQMVDLIKNGINLKIQKNNNTPKSNSQKSMQLYKNIKVPNKASISSQQAISQQKNSNNCHLKYQTLLNDRARSNQTDDEDFKQILATNSTSPQQRNTLSGNNQEFIKQQLQVFSQRDTRHQVSKNGNKKKQSVGSTEQAYLRFDENNLQKKQRNRSEQMGVKQLLTLNSQSQFATLTRQNPQIEQIQNILKKKGEKSQEKIKVIHNQVVDSCKVVSQDQKSSGLLKNQHLNSNITNQTDLQIKNNQLNQQQNANKLKENSQFIASNQNTMFQESKMTSDKSQDKRQESNQESKFKLKESEIQKIQLLFQQQQKKQTSNSNQKKQPANQINKQEDNSNNQEITQHQKQPFLKAQIQKQNQQFQNSYQQQQQQQQQIQQLLHHKKNSEQKQKSQEKQATQEIPFSVIQNKLQKQINTDRQQYNLNEVKQAAQHQYGRIQNTKELLGQNDLISMAGYPNTLQDINNTQINQQQIQQKQRMVSLNSRQSLIPVNNQQLEDDEELIALQQYSSPFLRSSSSSKEPNRRYEKQPLEKKNEIDKKIKDYLEQKQQNSSSQDSGCRQQIVGTPSLITNSTSNKNSSNQNSKSGNSNQNLLSSNLINSNLQSNKEYQRAHTESSAQQLQINQLNLEESQVHFQTEETVSHYSQSSSIKKNQNCSHNGKNQNSNNTPHRQQKAQLKSSVSQQIITPSTCDAKQQVTLVSPMISNFVISPSSKVITLSPKPYLTTENEDQEEQDVIITFSENVNTEGSEDLPQESNLQPNQEAGYNINKHKSIQKVNSSKTNKQEQINYKLESRLGALELEMSSIVQRCVNLEVLNRSLNQNIEKVNAEKDIILKENEIYRLKIEELQLINRQQEDTIEKLLQRITSQHDIHNLNTSHLKSNRNKGEYSNQYMNTENSTAEISSYPNGENMSFYSQSKGFQKSDAFSSARGVPISTQNTFKSKKDLNQYFSNMINNSQSKQLIPQTFQGYLSQKNLQNLMANSQIQNSNSLTQNDSLLSKQIFSQSTKNQSHNQQMYSFQNVNIDQEQAQASSYRNDYYLSSRHGIQNQQKQQ